MSDITLIVDTAVVVPVNILPLIEAADFKTIDAGVTYDEAGMDLRWNFVTAAGATSSTAVVPTTAGVHDWAILGDGMYSIEIPASAGTINNDTEGVGWFSGVCTACLPWRGPTISFVPANVANSLVSGTDNLQVDMTQCGGSAVAAGAIPNAAADAAGGLPISDAGGLDLDSMAAKATAHVTLTGTASAGSSTTITLTGGVATDGYYDGQTVVITSGTGAGQARTILSYALTGTVATVTRDWATAPSSDSVFVVIAADVPAILEAGTATGGGASTITLDAGASAIDGTYVNNHIMITGGTGLGQTRLIGAYVGSSKVATITPAWTTQPVSGSVYQILPAARVDVGGWSGDLVTAGSIPQAVAGEAGGLMVAGPNAATTLVSLSVTGELDAGSILVDGATTLTGAVTTGAVTKASESITGAWDAGSVLVDGTTTLTGAVTAPAGVTADITGTITTVTTCTNLTNAPTNGDLTATMKTSVQTAADAALVAENLDHLCKVAVANNADMTVEVVDGSILSNLLTSSDTSVFDPTTDSLAQLQAGAATVAEIWTYGTRRLSDATNITSDASAITTSSGVVSSVASTAAIGSGGIIAASFAADSIDANALKDDATIEIADSILARDIGSGSGVGTLDERTVRSALRALRNKWDISGTTYTVRKEDDSTTAWTSTLTTSGSAEAVTASDPTGP